MKHRFDHLLVVVVSTLLSACQSCGPFRAAWYLIGETDRQEMRVALLNEGTRSREIARVILNPAEDGTSQNWKIFDVNQALAAGEFLLLPKIALADNNAQSQGCRVPVHVMVQCKGPESTTRASVSGTMPNYLPEIWLNGCSK